MTAMADGDDTLPLSAASTIAALGEAPAAPPSGDGAPAALAGPGARYRRMGALGEGGMGEVQRVWDADLVRSLAVKRLKPELREDARMVRQFLWEARITAHLDHPNIVPIHDLALDAEGQLYFSMKHVAGTSLEAALARLREGTGMADGDAAPEALPARLRLFVSLCNAIAYAHDHGVLHRDLKPGNIMLGPHGEVLVMDWGLALPLPNARGEQLRPMLPEELASSSAGTPQYMSPEQAQGEALDARSDVFTLGAILYELVSLRCPYDGPTPVAVIAKVMTGERAPLHELAPDAGPSIAAVVERAMAQSPDERYPGVRELADDVERIIDGRTPQAEHAPLPLQMARYYMSHDPGMARLRVIDIDLWMLSAVLFGAAGGVLLAPFVGGWWWTLLVGSGVLSLPPTVRWLRERRNTS